MHYTNDIKERARALRVRGLALREIKENLQVPITTINSWVSDITLNYEQRKVLDERIQNSLQNGRIKAQKQKKDQREN